MGAPVEKTSGGHQTWENGWADWSTQWVPTFMVVPVPEFIWSVLYKDLGHSVIEPWVELMNNTLVSDD